MAWIKKNLLSILSLILVIGVTIAICLLYRNFPDLFLELQGLGYLGAFLISLLLNATVLLPAGNFLILFALATVLPSPLLVGLAGGAGAALGEITGYLAGRSGRSLIKPKSKTYLRLEVWLRKRGGITIFLLSVIPMVFDLVGMAAGALGYPFWQFLLFCWLGRSVLYVALCCLAPLGISTIIAGMQPLEIGISLVVVLVVVVLTVFFARRWLEKEG